MRVSVRQIFGPWHSGFVLDKHVLQSTYLGDDEFGHPRFDNQRSEAGQAVYALKYRNEIAKAWPLAQAVKAHILPRWSDPPSMIIPMPASKARPRQPVHEVAKSLGALLGIPVVEHLLLKNSTGKSMKDLGSKQERTAVLSSAFRLQDVIVGEGSWNALVLDDLFETGASMECACRVLRTYSKVRNIYAAALTWS